MKPIRSLELTDFGYGYLVNGGVVNDFVGEPDALLGELLARLVRDLHGALDSPAESVGLGELHGDGAPGVLVAVLLERLDHIACIYQFDSVPHQSLWTLDEREKNTRFVRACYYHLLVYSWLMSSSVSFL